MGKRVLRSPHLQDLQEDFKLKSFVEADGERKANYFEAAEGLQEAQQKIAGEVPTDGELVQLLSVTLMQDSELRAHIRKRQGNNSLSEEEWSDALNAAAGTIWECYLEEQDDE